MEISVVVCYLWSDHVTMYADVIFVANSNFAL